MTNRINLYKLAVFSVLQVVIFIVGCNDDNEIVSNTSDNNNEDTVTSINDDVALGQLQESGRDQGHSLLCIGLLGDICETAYSQGDDLYGYKNNLILKAAEYSAKYNMANLSVPFNTYTNCNNETHTVVSPDGRGNERPIWEKLYYHYVIENGITSRYVPMAARTVRPEGGGGDYGLNSGGFDLGFGTFLYSK